MWEKLCSELAFILEYSFPFCFALFSPPKYGVGLFMEGAQPRYSRCYLCFPLEFVVTFIISPTKVHSFNAGLRMSSSCRHFIAHVH